MAWHGLATQYDICSSIRKPESLVLVLGGDFPHEPHIAMEDVTPWDVGGSLNKNMASRT